jgi:FtsP/CotA-like multicopper oxidase with cupredoxin domain
MIHARTLPAELRHDRHYDLTLTGTQIGGQSYPDADPLPVADGEWVRFTMRNTSSKWHPMHLHGHRFQVLAPGGRGPVKDTVAVAARGGEVTFEVLNEAADDEGPGSPRETRPFLAVGDTGFEPVTSSV